MEPISRVSRSGEEAKAGYDTLSKWYDLIAGRSGRKSRQAGLALLKAQEGENVLEIGFGTGHCILGLGESVGPSGKVHSLDISEGMMNITASRIERAGLSNRVGLKIGDAANLPYPDNFFDAVFMSFTLELFDTPDIPVVLHHCRRVLKNGGRICVVAMSKQEKSGLMMRLYERGHETFPDYIDCRPIYVRQALENADFNIEADSRTSIWGLPVEIVLARKT